ncbi:MAG TPA: alpha/beta fold hydrolase, partial [Thermoanaerobaculia bacterium]
MRIEMGGGFEIRELGSGPTIVLVHGYPLDGGMWSAVARVLAERFRVVKPDLPGRAENPVPAAGTMESYAAFLEEIVGAAGGPVGLAGFSMGGYAALALLRRGPEALRALALVDTRAGADDEAGRAKRDEAISGVRARGAAAAADAMVDKLLSPEARGRSDMVERVRRMILRQKPETLESDLTAMRDRADQTDLLPGIRIPTLVLAGELDAITPPGPAREMASRIPGAEFVEIPGAGHLAPVEKPKVVAAALGAFF